MVRLHLTLLLVQTLSKQLNGSWTWVEGAGTEKQLSDRYVLPLIIQRELSNIYTMYSFMLYILQFGFEC